MERVEVAGYLGTNTYDAAKSKLRWASHTVVGVHKHTDVYIL